MPEADAVREAIAGCPFVVVSDISRRTDTGVVADVRLPAAGWGEKDGTVTNSERRISRQRPFLPLPGEARPDWWIITQVARRMGYGDAFSYGRPADIFAEHAALSAYENGGTRDFDLGGLVGAEYDTLPPTQWPVTTSSRSRFFSEGGFFTESGRARFVAVEPPHRRWTGAGLVHPQYGQGSRSLAYHDAHRQSRTAFGTHGRAVRRIHPDDAVRLGIRRATLSASRMRTVRRWCEHSSPIDSGAGICLSPCIGPSSSRRADG